MHIPGQPYGFRLQSRIISDISVHALITIGMVECMYSYWNFSNHVDSWVFFSFID